MHSLGPDVTDRAMARHRVDTLRQHGSRPTPSTGLPTAKQHVIGHAVIVNEPTCSSPGDAAVMQKVARLAGNPGKEKSSEAA